MKKPAPICAQCGNPLPVAGQNPWRPFCSERCKLLDLGGWLDERYRVPAEPPHDWEQQEKH